VASNGLCYAVPFKFPNSSAKGLIYFNPKYENIWLPRKRLQQGHTHIMLSSCWYHEAHKMNSTLAWQIVQQHFTTSNEFQEAVSVITKYCKDHFRSNHIQEKCLKTSTPGTDISLWPTKWYCLLLIHSFRCKFGTIEQECIPVCPCEACVERHLCLCLSYLFWQQSTFSHGSVQCDS
jgi:hypothetical protein